PMCPRRASARARTFVVGPLREDGRPLDDEAAPLRHAHLAVAVALLNVAEAHARGLPARPAPPKTDVPARGLATRQTCGGQGAARAGTAQPTHLSLGSSRATLDTWPGASRWKMPPAWSPWPRTCFLTWYRSRAPRARCPAVGAPRA